MSRGSNSSTKMGVFPLAAATQVEYLSVQFQTSSKMKIQSRRPSGVLVLFVAGALFLSGCKVLKSVNNFSNAAVGSLQNFEKLKASFTGEYVDLALFGQYGHFDGHFALTMDTPAAITRIQTLALAEGTDSGLNKIYQSLNGYFAGLAKLAADSLVEYQLDTLTAPLGGGAIIDTSKIKSSTIATTATIAGKLASAITGEYRLRHIKKYIAEANPLVKELAGAMSDALTSLDIKLDQRRQRLENSVFTPLLDSCSSPLERQQVVSDYRQAMAGIQYERQQIALYIQCLQVISASHDYMEKNIDLLREKAVKLALGHYASQLKDLGSQFNKIKNQK